MTVTLLPPSASVPERALERAMLPAAAVFEGVGDVLTFKENPADDVLPFLVWEYGLEDLIPYLPSLRDVIDKGLPWSRIKGTPASLVQALSWLGLTASVEEEEAVSTHWPEYMIDPGEIPTADQIEALTKLCGLSAPIGTRLSRAYHGYDVRRFILDKSPWGDLLSNYSGVKNENGVVLSFGREIDSWARANTQSPASALTRLHATRDYYPDRVIWDFDKFGDRHTLNYRASHSHLHQSATGTVKVLQTESDVTTLPKAAVVLSDSVDPFEGTNWCLFFFETVELNPPLPISDGLLLSGEPRNLIRRPIDERFDADYGAVSAWPYLPLCPTATHGVGYISFTTARQSWGHFVPGSFRWDYVAGYSNHYTDTDELSWSYDRYWDANTWYWPGQPTNRPWSYDRYWDGHLWTWPDGPDAITGAGALSAAAAALVGAGAVTITGTGTLPSAAPAALSGVGSIDGSWLGKYWDAINWRWEVI